MVFDQVYLQELGVMMHACSLALPALLELRKLRQEDLEFLGRLGYRGNFRTAWAIQ